MNTRICGLCKEEKPLEQFQRNKHNPRGRAYWCKVCRRAFDRERNLRQDRRLQIKEWEQSERGKQLRSIKRKRDIQENGQKYRARRILNKLIREGLIKRLPCEVCTDTKSKGHHPDYGKPIDVVWLCQKHHSEVHRILTI